MRLWTTAAALTLMTALATPAYAQVSQAEAAAFFKAHPPSSVQRMSVTEKIDYHIGNNEFAKSKVQFDSASATVTAQSNSLLIKDKTGAEALVPYSSIKLLSYNPENESVYAAINILVQ
jgi:hypothetical protein